jgi:hypothetical protein
MARTQITPSRVKDAVSTSAAKKFGTGFVKASTDGLYIKTTGYDSTKLVILVDRSSKGTGTGTLTIVAGSTAGNDIFSGNSTALNTAITVTSSTGTSRNLYAIGPLETARFKDTDGYIKLNCSSALTTAAGATEAAYVGAIYID